MVHYKTKIGIAAKSLLVILSADVKPPMTAPPPGDYDGSQTRQPDSNPPASSDIPSSKPGWFDPQHGMPSWNPPQPVSVLCTNGFNNLSD